jgi:hypothetical protein
VAALHPLRAKGVGKVGGMKKKSFNETSESFHRKQISFTHAGRFADYLLVELMKQ